jgi:hypothetical protein
MRGRSGWLSRVWPVALVACGRIGFDALPSSGDGGADAPTGVAQPKLVASSQVAGSGAQVTVTVAPIQAGDLVIVGVIMTTATVMTMSDDGPGDTYQPAGARGVSTAGLATEIWYAPNATAGATHVIVGLNTGSGATVWVAEFSGVDPVSALDGHAIVDNGSVSAQSSAPAVSTSIPNEVVFSILNSAGTTTSIASGSPFVALPVVVGDDSAYAIVATPGSYGAAWNMTGNGALCASTASFRPAP